MPGTRERWNCREFPTVGAQEPETAALIRDHLEAALVEQAVVSAAEVDEVVEGGFAASRPVMDVVGI